MAKKYTRQEAQQYVRDMTTGHHDNATSNHYVDIAKAVDDIYDGVEYRVCVNCVHYFEHHGVHSNSYFKKEERGERYQTSNCRKIMCDGECLAVEPDWYCGSFTRIDNDKREEDV